MADKLVIQENKTPWLGYVIISIALVALCAGGYLLYQQLMPSLPAKSDAEKSGSDAASSGGSGIISKAVDAVKTTVQHATNSTVFPLHQGSKGAEVSKVQHYLNLRYNAGLTEDGIWGSLTNKAIFNNASTTSVSKAEYDNMLHWLSQDHTYLTGVKSETDQNV